MLNMQRNEGRALEPGSSHFRGKKKKRGIFENHSNYEMLFISSKPPHCRLATKHGTDLIFIMQILGIKKTDHQLTSVSPERKTNNRK